MGIWDKATHWIYDTEEGSSWCLWNKVVRWFYFTKKALFDWLYPGTEADEISGQVDNALEVHRRQAEEVMHEIRKTGDNVKRHLMIAEEAIEIAKKTKYRNNNPNKSIVS